MMDLWPQQWWTCGLRKGFWRGVPAILSWNIRGLIPRNAEEPRRMGSRTNLDLGNCVVHQPQAPPGPRHLFPQVPELELQSWGPLPSPGQLVDRGSQRGQLFKATPTPEPLLQVHYSSPSAQCASFAPRPTDVVPKSAPRSLPICKSLSQKLQGTWHKAKPASLNCYVHGASIPWGVPLAVWAGLGTRWTVIVYLGEGVQRATQLTCNGLWGQRGSRPSLLPGDMWTLGFPSWKSSLSLSFFFLGGGVDFYPVIGSLHHLEVLPYFKLESLLLWCIPISSPFSFMELCSCQERKLKGNKDIWFSYSDWHPQFRRVRGKSSE